MKTCVKCDGPIVPELSPEVDERCEECADDQVYHYRLICRHCPMQTRTVTLQGSQGLADIHTTVNATHKMEIGSLDDADAPILVRYMDPFTGQPTQSQRQTPHNYNPASRQYEVKP